MFLFVCFCSGSKFRVGDVDSHDATAVADVAVAAAAAAAVGGLRHASTDGSRLAVITRKGRCSTSRRVRRPTSRRHRPPKLGHFIIYFSAFFPQVRHGKRINNFIFFIFFVGRVFLHRSAVPPACMYHHSNTQTGRHFIFFIFPLGFHSASGGRRAGKGGGEGRGYCIGAMTLLHLISVRPFPAGRCNANGRYRDKTAPQQFSYSTFVSARRGGRNAGKHS